MTAAPPAAAEAAAAGQPPADQRTLARMRRRSASRQVRLLSASSRAAMWAGLLLGLCVYAVFGLAPAALNVLFSFTNYSLYPGAPVSWAGLQNYTTMFTSELPGVEPALVATAVFVVAVTVLQNVIALAVAHRLVGDSRWNGFLRLLVFLPIVLGVTIVGSIWLIIFNPTQSPAASLWGLFGANSAFFGSDSLAMPLVIGVQVWQNIGFTAFVFIGALKAINPDIYQAAALDGVTRWQRLRRITWPLLAPAVTVNLLLAVVGSATLYSLIYVLTSGDHGTMTLGMLSFNEAFTNANLGFGAALATMLFVITLIVALPLMVYLRGRERRLLA
jgi:raffinose/stachyose/melibiose transport system permease protein